MLVAYWSSSRLYWLGANIFLVQKLLPSPFLQMIGLARLSFVHGSLIFLLQQFDSLRCYTRHHYYLISTQANTHANVIDLSEISRRGFSVLKGKSATLLTFRCQACNDVQKNPEPWLVYLLLWCWRNLRRLARRWDGEPCPSLIEDFCCQKPPLPPQNFTFLQIDADSLESLASQCIYLKIANKK